MSEKFSLVIESAPFVTRWALSSGEALKEGEPLYGTVGYRIPEPPDERDKRERGYGWTSLGEQYEWQAWGEGSVLTLERLWGALLQRGGGLEERRAAARALADAAIASVTQSPDFREFASGSRGFALESLVFMVPEYLDGVGQKSLHDALVRSCGNWRIGERNIFLLFRSVALALAHVADSEMAEEGELLILDCGHYRYEASTLEIEPREGHLIPKRSFRTRRGLGNSAPHTLEEVLQQGYDIGPGTLEKHEKIRLHRAVDQGSALQPLLTFDEEAFCYSTLRPRREGQKPHVEALGDHIMEWDSAADEAQQGQIYGCMRQYLEGNDAGPGIVHGWPLLLHGSDSLDLGAAGLVTLGNGAVLQGGMEFARRRREGETTYHEEIPRFEIYLHEGRRYDEDNPLIEAEDLEGLTRRAGQVNDEDFRIRTGSDFRCGVRIVEEDGREAEARCVSVPAPEEEVEITIAADVQPMAGGIRFTIKARHATGSKFKAVHMNWDEAEPFEPPTPERVRRAYPRTIEYAGEGRQRDELLRIIGGASGPDGDLLGPSLMGRGRKRIKDILHPNMKNGYEVAFGSETVEDLEGRLLAWVRQLNEAATNELGSPAPDYGLVELAGDTFAHALPEFRQAMAQRMFGRGAMGENNLACWAFGRICDRPEWLEAFIGRFLAPEEVERFDRKRYQVIWPFQKSLALYEDAARISEEAGYKMFCYLERTLAQIVGRSLPQQDFAHGNAKKWVLSAILFGLRVRAHHPRFLDPDEGEGSMAMRLCALVEEVPVRVPSLALKQASYEGSLSDIVIRFIKREATEEDDAIVGGIGRS